MKKIVVLLSVFIVVLIIGVTQAFFSGTTTSEESAMAEKPKDIPVVDWKLLYKLDYKTGAAPDEVKNLNKQWARIPGFIVPLSDSATILDEFLLVPDEQSCVHVPPPPPNLIVHVKLKKPISAKEIPRPAWVTGILRIETTKSIHGPSAYKMTATKVEQFKYQ